MEYLYKNNILLTDEELNIWYSNQGYIDHNINNNTNNIIDNNTNNIIDNNNILPWESVEVINTTHFNKNKKKNNINYKHH